MTLSLCQLARKTLEEYFKGKQFKPDSLTIKACNNKACCFVTITKNGFLRGCIGSLQPNQELWKNIQENAINAAFFDPRFPPLSEKELPKIKIEVSVLSKPKKLEFLNSEELLKKINEKMGIILKHKTGKTSTFLPQVWEKIPDKITFLEELSLKAGLDGDAWKQKDIEIWYYTVNAEEE